MSEQDSIKPGSRGSEKVNTGFSDHAERLWLFAVAISGNPSIADDAVQEAFCSLLKIDINAVGNVQKYLFRSVRNKTLNLLRTERRERRKLEVVSSQRPIFIEPAERHEELTRLNECVALLPREQREIILLKIWGGLTFKEIGELLDLPMNTAASRYRYALEKLRTAMEDYYEK